MNDIWTALQGLGSPAAALARAGGLTVYPRSVQPCADGTVFLGRQAGALTLGYVGRAAPPDGFCLETDSDATLPAQLAPSRLWLGAANHANAAALRQHLPWTGPVPGGLRLSAGLGDRLGVATPGHIRAIRAAGDIFPILAQQSIREMERTQRTPDEVMDDATWGVLQEGWTAGFGADADHLKSAADIDLCVASGYVLYTLDPRDHVDAEADSDDLATLQAKFVVLPWEQLETTPDEVYRRYVGQVFSLSAAYTLTISEEQALRAAAKYGRAVAHLTALSRHLAVAMSGRPYELEISVDETDTPTRAQEHYYIASELKRLGVTWVSLAPRYVGRFEKGVDYIGDLDEFAVEFAKHAAIARALGPYKLSLHSGSDKFSVYPIAARLAGELIHLKTAGTSYLEALRAVAQVQPSLFREVLAYAVAHWDTERASYHVSAEMAQVPTWQDWPDAALPMLLDDFHARQALHVSFGLVLTSRDAQGGYLFRDRIYAVLAGDEEAHYAALERHFARHLQPFVMSQEAR
jgi:hypothetical protein